MSSRVHGNCHERITHNNSTLLPGSVVTQRYFSSGLLHEVFALLIGFTISSVHVTICCSVQV